MNVLLVEDDPRVSGFVERGLDELGFRVEVVRDGLSGLKRALKGSHEVVVLDLMLPGLNGTDVISELRRRETSVPVLVISARDGVSDRVGALDRGADDFLVKPFSFDELVARIRALARRPPTLAGSVLEVADLRMDLGALRVERGGREITLTRKEFALLEYLLRRRDTVVTRTMIAEQVWGVLYHSCGNVIAVYIHYLRNKVDGGSDVKLIHTIRGIGYTLSERSA